MYKFAALVCGMYITTNARMYLEFINELSIWKLTYLDSFNFLKGLCTMQCTSKHKLQMQLSIYDATQWNQNFYKFLYVDREGILHKYFCHIIGCSLSKGWSVWNPTYIKFMFSKKATKIDKIFTFNLTVCSNCRINGEDFIIFCGLLRKDQL